MNATNFAKYRAVTDVSDDGNDYDDRIKETHALCHLIAIRAICPSRGLICTAAEVIWMDSPVGGVT